MKDTTIFNLEEILAQYGAKSKLRKTPTEVIYIPRSAYEDDELRTSKPQPKLKKSPASPAPPPPKRVGAPKVYSDGPYCPDYFFVSDRYWDKKEVDRSIPWHFTDAEDRRTPVATRRDVCDWLESLVVTAASVILIMTFVARVNQVYGVSMQPTLSEGDRLIVTPLFNELDYGDIIVLEAPNLPNSVTGTMGEPIVKRIIGLPGDEIFISRQTGEVFRNGERLEELYITEKILPFKAGNQIYPLVLNDNMLFVMGDNRNQSTDSRVTAGNGIVYYVGCVDINRVIGKAVFRIYPFGGFGGLR